MVTYWLTKYPCPSCGETANTKMSMYPFGKDTEKFQEELDSIKRRILSDMVSEPSNGWPSPDYETSWRIGLVKIRTGKKQYSMRCFRCGFETNESKFKEYLESLKENTTQNKKKIERDKEFFIIQPTIDQYF